MNTSFHFSTPAYNNTESCVDQLHPGPPYKTGGLLSIIKDTVDYQLTPYTETWVYGAQNYKGRFNAAAVGISASQPNIAPYGAKAWNRMVPVRPVLQMGVFLAELRDVPKMLRSTQDILKTYMRGGVNYNPGGAWLNYQFGWKPFFDDILKLFNAAEQVDKKIAFLKRENGQSLRRRIILGEGVDTWAIGSGVSQFSCLNPTIYTQAYATPYYRSFWSKEGSYQYKLWASARFRYWIPPYRFNDSQFLLRAQLMGLVPNLDLVYQVMPWSWLIDYFTNLGDVLSNISLNAAHTVVADYAYLMGTHTHKTHSRGNIVVWNRAGKETNIRAYTVATKEWKQRTVANPYGFGVTDGSLSAFQWSILVALGLTRLR